jgi:hypothetical protein
MVGTIAAVVMEPYTNFIVRLHTEGRVTAAEIEELHRAFLDRSEHLGELVQARLGRPSPSQPK